MDEEDQLQKWKEEYVTCKSVPCYWISYRDIGQYLGMTYMYNNPKKASISVSVRLKTHDSASYCTLWHEFCHYWAWADETYDGHGLPFLKRLMKKPVIGTLGAIWSAVWFIIG